MRVSLAVCLLLALAGSAFAEFVTDDFANGSLDSPWQIVAQETGATLSESGGTLRIGGAAGQSSGLLLRYDRPIEDSATVRIDYNWLSCTAHKARMGLALFGYDSHWDAETNGPYNGLYIKGVRYGTGGSLHAIDGSGTDIPYQIAYSVPTSGALRIVRNGNNFQASYLDGATWHVLYDVQHDFGGMPLYPYLYTSNSDSNPSWQVAMDDFSANVAVPEPSTAVLLSTVAVSLVVVVVGWRKRQSH